MEKLTASIFWHSSIKSYFSRVNKSILVTVYEILGPSVNAIGNKKRVEITACDLSQAFDCVYHHICWIGCSTTLFVDQTVQVLYSELLLVFGINCSK